MNKWLALAIALAACYGAAAIGGQFRPGEWYAQLAKPSWNPPSAVFAPVWLVLYGMMAIAAWLVWQQPNRLRGTALAAFALQLALNIAWSWLFFGMERVDLALIDIGLLWLAIATTLFLFWRIHVVAGALMVPYLLWVTFASALNFAIWRLN
ncbi:MAG TPA: TspO/MBR family protein [Longimicrobiales bacterium]|nr:TspO/MBR family protein [Longimicrobiales bacterium]